MNIYVCIKQVPDTETKIKLNADKSNIDTAGIKWVMNPYDEFAVEEAIQLKSKTEGSNLKVITVGPKSRVTDALRTALAMGADEALLIDAPESIDTFNTAKALAAAIKQEGEPFQVFTGKQAIDDNAASVSQMLAEFLEIPHATVISKFEKSSDSAVVEREVEGGRKEVIELKGPSVVAANKGLNKPRYASLPNIMKAKKKPVKEIELSSLGVDADLAKLKFTNFELPAEKPPVKMIEGEADQQAKELVRLLREEAKVI